MPAKKPFSLTDLEKKPVFELPDGYFEQLPSAIQRKIASQKSAKVWVLPAWLRYSLSFASLALLLLVGYILYPRLSSHTSNPTQMLSQASDEEIINFLRNSGEISQQEWIEVATHADVRVESPVLKNLPFTEESVVEEIDPYILEESL